MDVLSSSGHGPRPLVTIHYAQSLDGRIATRTGHSQWMSGEESLRLAHQLRAGHEAIMVGIGTVLADNPSLTVRHVPGSSPLRVVVDSTLRLPLDANVLTDDAAPTIVATTARADGARVEAICARGAEVLVLEDDGQDRVSLETLLDRLAARGVGSVLLEGGRGLITQALRRRLVNRLVVCIAPKLVGAGIEAVGDLDVHSLSDALTFQDRSFTPLGEDMIFEGTLAAPPPLA